MNIVFWMDNPSTFNPNKDTTYCLIHEALARNHSVFYASKSSFSIQNNTLLCNVQQILPFSFGSIIIPETNTQILTNKDVQVMWLRCDPPVNEVYYNQMLLLDQFSSEIFMINHPRGIINNNEKLSILNFPSIIPETFISNDKQSIIDFSNQFREVVLKPLDGFGGAGVFKLRSTDTNLEPTIEILTNNGNQLIIAQKALNHSNGDKRILILNGEPIGAVLRQSNESHRNNFMAGGIAIKTTINEHDHQIIDTIRPFLLEQKLHFVGIDIIDNLLIEINVTSPTCLQEMNTLNNYKLENKVISFLENEIMVNN